MIIERRKVKKILLFKKIGFFEFVCLLSYLIICIVLIIYGIHYSPGSYSYVNALIIRSPVYPLFIDFFQLIFKSNFEFPLFVIQLSLGLYGIFYFVKTIYLIFPIKRWTLFVLSLIIVTPYLFPSKIGNNILSEGLAYPLFLFFISNLFRGFFFESRNKLYVSAVILFLLVLTREQFLFVLPLSILLLIYLAFKNNSIKRYLFLLVIYFSIPVLCSITDKVYHKICFGYYVSTPWTGIHLAALPFFVSDKDDYKIFKNKEEQDYFKTIYYELTYSGLTLNEYIKTNIDSRGFTFYTRNFTTIANLTIDPAGRKFFEDADNNYKYILNDKMAKKIAIPLIKKNLYTCLKFYIMNIVTGIGQERLLFTYPIFLFFSFSQMIKRFQKIDIFIFICFLISFSNVCLIALGQPLTNYRYTIYSDFLIYTSFIILLSHVFNFNNYDRQK
jgi:hypothetical protein